MNANRSTIFGSLTLPRQLSLHAVLTGDPHQDLPSSKTDALRGQLREVAGGGHRALVFSSPDSPARSAGGRTPKACSTATSTARPQPGRGAAALQGRRGSGLRDQPQSGRLVFGARLEANDICGLFASAVVAAWGGRRRGIAGSGGIHLTGLAQLKGWPRTGPVRDELGPWPARMTSIP